MSSASQFGVVQRVDGVAPVAGNVAFTSTGGTIIITPGVGTINFDTSGGGSGVTITGDSGSATGTNITLTGGASGAFFTAGGTTVTESFTFLQLPATTSSSLGIVFIDTVPFLHGYGLTVDHNTFVGGAGNFTLNTGLAGGNCAVGYQSMFSLTDGAQNNAVGYQSLGSLLTGNNNCAIGLQSLASLVSGSGSVAVGNQSLSGSLGSRNIGIGILSGSAYSSTESDNIVIGSPGVAAESNTIRIGVQGSSSGQQDTCSIAGIYGNTPSGTSQSVFVDTDGTLSSAPGGTLKYTAVNTTPYTVLATDEYLGVDSSGSAIVIRLPNTAATGRVWTVKDSGGTSASNNITVTTVGGVVTIDGSTTYLMTTPYESISVLFNGASYEIY